MKVEETNMRDEKINCIETRIHTLILILHSQSPFEFFLCGITSLKKKNQRRERNHRTDAGDPKDNQGR